MTDPTEAILAYLRQIGAGLDPDFLREAVRAMSTLLMEMEVKQQIGADRYERTENRTTNRNGYRDRDWQTRVGDVPLKIPRLREGSYFPSLLEPRRQAEQALLSVIQQAYIQGVSTRRVDELVKALGLTGIFPDQDSVIRLVGSVLMEIDDEWQVERRYFSQDSMRKLKEPDETLASSPGALQLGPIR